MALSLNNTVVARIAAALYGQQLGAASMTEALSEVSNLGSVEAWANQVFSRDFGTPTLALASKILANVGVADDAKSTLATWLLGQMNTPKPGTTLVGLLNSFAATPSTGAYATQAASFNSTISNAVVYASTYGTTDLTLTQAASVPVQFTLQAGVDNLNPTGNATINGTLGTSATFTAFDSIAATGNKNTLILADTTTGAQSSSVGDILPAGATLSGVQTVQLSTVSNAGIASSPVGYFDVSGNTGETGVTVVSTGSGVDYVKAAATTNINDTATAGGVTTQGGQNVTISAKGVVSVGTSSTTLPAGTVTITETATSAPASVVTVLGGTNISVTSTGTGGAGQITIGVTGGGSYDPSGSVAVTATNGAPVNSYGGSSVTINETGSGAINVGASNSLAAGDILVTQSSLNGGASGAIAVLGGASETIVSAGGKGASAFAAGSSSSSSNNTKGAISITDTNSGDDSADAFAVYGGSTVSITTNPTSAAIAVGSSTAAYDPTGNVTINNSEPNSASPTGFSYGGGTSTVYTNGATTVVISGGASDAITDIGTAASTPTSVLTTVSLAGTSGTDTIASNVLSNLTLTNQAASVTVTAATGTRTLNLNLVKNTGGTVTDATATTVAVTASGASSVNSAGASNSSNMTLSVAKATSVSINASSALAIYALNAAYDTSLSLNGSALTTIDGFGTTSKLTSITLTNGAGLTAPSLGSMTALTKIDASASTGNVTVALNESAAGFATPTQFIGGSGTDKITVTTNSIGASLVAGSASNNQLVANYVAASGDNSLSSQTSNFSILTLGANASSGPASTSATNAYDATGFSTIQVGAVAKGVAFSNVANAETLNITAGTNSIAAATQNTVTVGFASPGSVHSLTVNLGSDGVIAAPSNSSPSIGVNVGQSAYPELLSASNANTFTINSYGVPGSFAVTDTTANFLSLTGAANASITIGGDSSLTLSSPSPSTVRTINASAMTSGTLNTTGITLDATQATITGGAGTLIANGGASTGATTINSGSGGATITIGVGGALVNTLTGASPNAISKTWHSPSPSPITTGSGSEYYNLTASTGVADTLIVNDAQEIYNAPGTTEFNFNSLRATVTGFTISSNSFTGDQFTLENTVSAGTTTVIPRNVIAPVTTSSTTNEASGSTETYKVSNGIISFSSSTFSSNLADAISIVGAHNDQVAAFVNGSDTYLVTSGHTTANSPGGSVADVVDVVKLSGVTATDIGTTPAIGTIVITDALDVASPAALPVIVSGTTSTTTDLTGYGAVIVLASPSPGTDGASSATLAPGGYNALTNLAQSSVVTVKNSNSPGIHDGNISTTQTGTSGQNSMTFDLYSTSPGTDYAVNVDFLKVTGDWLLVINGEETGTTGVTQGVGTITDGGTTNTLTTIQVTDVVMNAPGHGTAIDIGAIVDTALTTVDASATTAAFTLGDGTTISQAGLTILGGTGANTITASGAADVFTTNSLAAATITMAGAGDKITFAGEASTAVPAAESLTGAVLIKAAGSGDTIDVHALTAGSSSPNIVTIEGADSSHGVGSSANILLGAGYATSGYYNNVLAGSNTTVSLGGDYNQITLTYASAYGTTGNTVTVKLGTIDASTGYNTAATNYGAHEVLNTGASTTVAAGEANVSGATSLSSALNIAATFAEAAATASPATLSATVDSVTWFQYSGNTYVLDAIGTGATGTHSLTGLDTTDKVVTITGLVDVTLSAAGHTATF